MKPPYEITSEILQSLTAIAELLGEVQAIHLHTPSVELRKRNRVKTIQSSLAIEGNTLSEEQITALINNKRVIGPKEDVIEVQNAIRVYDSLSEFDPYSMKAFLRAHKWLMEGLVDRPGQLRTQSVGIIKGNNVSHVAPPAAHLPQLLKDLFHYVKHDPDPILLKSCVAHYEIEFIHPFMDGNGRMGRLWQTLLLMQQYPVFAYLPFETIIKSRQTEYYKTLEQSDKTGQSTPFITFMLSAIQTSLHELLAIQQPPKTGEERVQYFISRFKGNDFTRKDYLQLFKSISSATASRDLQKAAEEGILHKTGDKRTTIYKLPNL